MIEELNLQNFKNFEENQVIPLKPLTLIYGPNSSGKSSILQSLLMLKQTLESSNNSDIVLSPNGDYVDVGNYREFINKHDINKTFHIKFSANLPKDIKPFKNLTFKQLKANKFSLEIEFGTDSEIVIKRINVYVGKDNICSLTNANNYHIKNGQMRIRYPSESAKCKFKISNFNWNTSFWNDFWLLFQKDASLILEKIDKSDFSSYYENRKKDLEKKLEELEAEFSTELNQIEQLREKIDEVESKQQDLDWEKDDLKENQTKLEKHKEELEDVKEKLEDKIQEFKDEVQKGTPALELSYFNIDIPELENRISELEELIKELGADIDNSGSNISSVGYDIEELETDTSSDVGTDIQSLGDEIELIGSNINSFDELYELDSYISELDYKIDELDDKIDELGGLTSELEDAIFEIEKQLKPIDLHRKEIRELEDELTYYIDLRKIAKNKDYLFLQQKYEEIYRNVLFDLNNFLPIINKLSSSNPNNKDFERYNRINLIEIIQYLSDTIKEYLKKIDYISSLRTKPSRHYTFDGNIYEYVGQAGEMVPNILFKNEALVDNINKLFKNFELDYKLEIAKLNKNEKDLIDSFSLKLIDTNTNITLSLLDVGFGICQLLPIVVQCLIAKDKILLVEEPEIHLHPKLQAELGEFIAKSIKKGKNNKFILETHSENIILRIQKLIRKGELNSDDIAVIYVEKNSNNSVCHNLRIDKQGEFIDDWPNGFFEESFNELFG